MHGIGLSKLNPWGLVGVSAAKLPDRLEAVFRRLHPQDSFYGCFVGGSGEKLWLRRGVSCAAFSSSHHEGWGSPVQFLGTFVPALTNQTAGRSDAGGVPQVVALGLVNAETYPRLRRELHRLRMRRQATSERRPLHFRWQR